MTWLRYVPHFQLVEFLRKGWVIEDELHGSSHAEHATLMRWGGDGEPE